MVRMCSSCRKEHPESEFHSVGKDGARVGKWCKDGYSKNRKEPSKQPTPAGTEAQQVPVSSISGVKV
jgi:hypothetical protein